MSSVLKKMASLYGKLQWAYSQGLIAYPRVANNYMEVKNLKFYEYPHKPLTTFDEYSHPLMQESYPFSKETLPLHLTHLNISTPATLLKNLGYIDEFFDDSLNLRSHAKDIEQNLEAALEILRENAHDIYMQEVSDGTRKYTEDPLTMSDAELLNIIAKDGDVVANFEIPIMPYSIDLSPYKNAQEEEEQEEERKKTVLPLSNPSVFKPFVSPSRCFQDEVVENPIPIQNINDYILLENIRAGYMDTEEHLAEISIVHENKIDNLHIMESGAL